MMKKIRFLFFVFLVFTFFPCYVVNASSYDTSTSYDNTHKVIYSVENFNISGDYLMTFDGYAFIENVHNYGIISGTNNGNLKTSLVAYVGDWNSNYKDSTNCNNSENCMWFSATQSARDMYMLNCEPSSNCTADRQQALRANSNAINNVNADSVYPCNVGNNSYCLYYNVGFTVKVSLLDLEEQFGEKTINFRIVLSVKGKSTTSDNQTLSSDLGVYEKICKYKNSACQFNNGVLTVGDYDLTLSGMSNHAYIAEGSWARTCSQGGASCYENELEFSDELFEICGITNPGGEFESYNLNEGLVWKDKVYEVASYKNEEKNIVYSKEGGCSADGQNYYAYGGWMAITGKLTISGLKPRIVTETCDSMFSNTSNTDKTADCGESANYNQCMSKEITDAVIYFPITSCTGYSDVIEYPSGSGNYYQKVNVKASVLLNQEAKFTFGNLSKDVIYAGKGFELGTTSYNNTITWVNANRLKSSNIPYYSYGAVRKSNGTSCEGETLSLSDNVDTMVYYKNASGNWVKATLSQASFEVVNLKVQNLINTSNVNNIKFASCDSNDSSNCDAANPNYDVEGSWTGDSSNSVVENYNFMGKLFGKKITNKYSYQLADSYVIVKGDEAGKAEYINNAADVTEEMRATGNKFYVDFKWVYNASFPFNLTKKETINLSFLDGMNWTLNGTCSVDVKDGYYTDADGDGDGDDIELLYKYRSITVENPFPKADSLFNNIALNWREWYKDDNNKKRIANSYNYGPFYQVTLSKTGSSDTVKISEINSITRHYIDTSNLDLNGESDFVRNYFSTRVSAGQKGFCELGTFSTDCDKVW